MEGLPLPDYSFLDLAGSIYDKNTMNGKLLVIKCWFINCIPCVAEMPKLNDMVSQYKYRDDVVFLSLAFDKVKELQIFLKKTKFKYQVVADKEYYMRNILK
jgi:peroxiredoxin